MKHFIFILLTCFLSSDALAECNDKVCPTGAEVKNITGRQLFVKGEDITYSLNKNGVKWVVMIDEVNGLSEENKIEKARYYLGKVNPGIPIHERYDELVPGLCQKYCLYADDIDGSYTSVSAMYFETN